MVLKIFFTAAFISSLWEYDFFSDLSTKHLNYATSLKLIIYRSQHAIICSTTKNKLGPLLSISIFLKLMQNHFQWRSFLCRVNLISLQSRNKRAACVLARFHFLKLIFCAIVWTTKTVQQRKWEKIHPGKTCALNYVLHY